MRRRPPARIATRAERRTVVPLRHYTLPRQATQHAAHPVGSPDAHRLSARSGGWGTYDREATRHSPAPGAEQRGRRGRGTCPCSPTIGYAIMTVMLLPIGSLRRARFGPHRDLLALLALL